MTIDPHTRVTPLLFMYALIDQGVSSGQIEFELSVSFSSLWPKLLNRIPLLYRSSLKDELLAPDLPKS